MSVAVRVAVAHWSSLLWSSSWVATELLGLYETNHDVRAECCRWRSQCARTRLAGRCRVATSTGVRGVAQEPSRWVDKTWYTCAIVHPWPAEEPEPHDVRSAGPATRRALGCEPDLFLAGTHGSRPVGVSLHSGCTRRRGRVRCVGRSRTDARLFPLVRLDSNMDKELAVAMGSAARHARHALQLTQQQVADQLGVSVEFYSRMERGLAHPGLEVFLRMLEVLGVRADTLLGLDAAHAATPVAVPLTSPDDSRDVRRVVAALQKLPASTSRFVTALLSEFERLEAASKRGRRRGRRSHAPPPAPRKK
jgi:transcriptional regulator with XRE-family HTH domain